MDADILPDPHGSLELPDMCVVSDMDSRDAVFKPIDVANKILQVGDLHIGDDEDVGSGWLLKGLDVPDIQLSTSSKIMADGLIYLRPLTGVVKDLAVTGPGMAEVVDCHRRIISEVSIRGTGRPKDRIGEVLSWIDHTAR